MGDLKGAISMLCKHINSIFDMKIKPEMFRLAKFNKTDNDIVETFWILLSNMINLLTSEEVVQDVKRYFLSNLKYKSVYFYALPEDMSDGSRELLLAFAYLLSQDYLNKYVKDMITNSSLNPYYEPEMEHIQYKIDNLSLNIKNIKSESDLENALQWIEGRIKHNNKTISEYETCFLQLSAKVCKQNLFYLTEQLPIPAILAFNNTQYAKTFLEETETVSKIVESHERWLKVQSIFWEWMNSVLLERQKTLHNAINHEELNKFIAAANELK